MKYTYEFKRQVVNDYLAKRGGVQALAKAYGIPAKSLVRQWIKAYQELGDEGLMPSPSKKRYPAEYKQQAVEQYLSTGASLSRMAAELGLKNPATLNRWVREYQKDGTDAWKGKKRGRPKKNEDHGRISCFHDFSFTKERKIITINRDNKQGYEGEALD